MEEMYVFPLPLVVIENEVLKLHIFEARYRFLLEKAENENLLFAIPTALPAGISNTASIVKWVKTDKRYEGGESDVTLRCVSRGKILEYLPSENPELPSGARMEIFSYRFNESKEFSLRIFDLFEGLYQKIGLSIPEFLDANADITAMYQKCGMSLIQKLEFANLNSTLERQQYLFNYLRNVIPGEEETEELKQVIRQNGHHKIFPQKL